MNVLSEYQAGEGCAKEEGRSEGERGKGGVREERVK